jgi:hypothetical protein
VKPLLSREIVPAHRATPLYASQELDWLIATTIDTTAADLFDSLPGSANRAQESTQEAGEDSICDFAIAPSIPLLHLNRFAMFSINGTAEIPYRAQLDHSTHHLGIKSLYKKTALRTSPKRGSYFDPW